MSINRKIKIVGVPADQWACGQLRIIQPIRDLAKEFNNSEEFQFDICFPQPNVPVNISDFQQYDIVYMQRITESSTLNFAMELRKSGKVIIQDIDDDLIDAGRYAFVRLTKPIQRGLRVR